MLETSLSLVTGAASGIGAAVVAALCSRGARVAAFDIDERGLCALEAKHGPSVRPYPVDVSSSVAVENAVAAVERDLGTIDALVHAAGVLILGPLCDDELRPETFRRAWSVNTEAVWLVSRAVARGMKLRRRGAIVVVSSNAALVPRLGMGAYCASKAATTMLARCLALELAGYGIRCNVVSPGSTDTPMLRRMLNGQDVQDLVAGDSERFRLGIPLGRIARPEDVADAVMFLLSPGARHITLQDLRVDGGATC
jgi:2,3-dihydro-2,3-dihydroxybenzoate dehydrogenase